MLVSIKRFEDCIAWQKAQDLAVEVYGYFEHSKRYSFKDQIERASTSISNNISEGFDRLTNKDFIRYLGIAIGSCNETKSMLYLSKRLSYMDAVNADRLISDCEEINRIIWGLIRKLNESPLKSNP